MALATPATPRTVLGGVTGAMCPSAQKGLEPCYNTPTVFGALVKSGALSASQNMFSLYIANDTTINGMFLTKCAIQG